jgi:type II secretory pathway component PulF
VAKLKDIDILRSVQLLIASGMSIASACFEIAERINDKVAAEKLITIGELVSNRGFLFSDALEHVELCKDHLPIVRVGEKSGQLNDILREVIASMEEMERIKKQVISSLVYPGIVIAFSLLVGIGLTFVLQMVLDALKLPGSDEIFAYQLGWFLVDNRWWLFFGYAGFVMLFVVVIYKNISRVPVLKNIYSQISIGKAFGLIGLSLRSRESIVQSFQYASQSVHGVWSDRFGFMSEDLRTRNTLDVIDEIEPYMPPEDYLILRTKIKSGDTWGGFSTIGKRQVENAMRKLTTLTPLANAVALFFAAGQIVVLMSPIALIMISYIDEVLKFG